MVERVSGSALTDERLLERARGGDPTALHTVFDRHRDVLEARIRRFLPPAVQQRVSVADVLQETRILAFERTGTFESHREGAYRIWLLEIAERKAREALRAHAGTSKRAVGREVPGAAGAGSHEPVAPGPSPSQSALAGERSAAVLRALATLSATHRDVLRLAGLEGRRIGEVAERMARSPDAVKKLYGRALTRLAEALASMGMAP